jgi:hypothetical protein
MKSSLGHEDEVMMLVVSFDSVHLLTWHRAQGSGGLGQSQ